MTAVSCLNDHTVKGVRGRACVCVCVYVYVMEVRSERAEWGCLAGGRRYNVPLQLAQLQPPRSPVRHIAFTFPTTRMDVNSIRSGQSFGPLGIPSNPLFMA